MDGNFSAMAMPAQRFGIPWGSASSLAAHALLIAALLLASPLRPLVVPPPRPVTVEILSEEQFAALQTPSEARPLPAPGGEIAEPAAPAATTEPDAAESAETTPLVHRATQFYAADLLEEPGMARVRQALTTPAGSERMVQLCNIEGLEQIRRADSGMDPDTLVAYAMADLMASGLTMRATGGAFRSRRKWYGVAFTCTVAADYSGVTGFEFQLGDAIPEAQWEAHDLNAEDIDE